MVANSKKTHRALLFLLIAIIIIIGFITWVWINSDEKHLTSSSPQGSSAHTTQPALKNQLACIDQLPTSTKLGQKIMVAGYTDTLISRSKMFAADHLGGVILMDESPRSTIASFASAQTITPFIATDQEGGNVQRYTSEGTLPGATAMTKLSTSTAFNDYLRDDKYLASLGITTNFSPVVDVLYPSKNPLPGRMYSSDSNTVTAYATQSIKAAQEAGLQPVIKHFPGLGSADGNTDYGTVSTTSFAHLKTNDLIPYQKLLTMNPDVMVSNATVSGLTNGDPASLSRAAITNTLRNQLGYKKSVVYTDSLTAKAVPGLLTNAAIKSWKAGADVALIVQTKEQDPVVASYISAIIKAGEHALADKSLSSSELNQSVERIFARKHIDACTLSAS